MEHPVTEMINSVESKLDQRYCRLSINGKFCFMKPNGIVFSLQKMPGEEAIVVEYADSYTEALLNRFEDGDRFYIQDLDKETLIQRILYEIDQ